VKCGRNSQGFLKNVKAFQYRTDTTNVNHVTAPSSQFPARARRPLRVAMFSTLALVGGLLGFGASNPAAAVSDNDWLGVVNTYRAMSGVAPVSENASWSAEAQAHSCYMLQNGITHDEIPGRAGYSAGGDIAGNSGNVAVSSSVSASIRSHIDLWMTGPFHAIGILRSNLTSSGFGLCANANTPTPWHSGATLDVIRGLDYSAPKATSPIVFPGDGATVPLNSFITEYPNPMTLCGWTGSAGLPLIAMMPNDVSAATATITGPNGPVPTCALHKGNTGGDATARAILDGDNAVIVMPRTVLADGTYTVNVTTDGGSVTWSFTVDRDAPLQAAPPETPDTAATANAAKFEPVEPFRLVDTRENLGAVRLKTGQVARIRVGAGDISAVSANLAVVNASGYGYITAFNCTTDVPTVSTLGYRPGETVANQAIVPLDDGVMCIYSKAATDLIVDVNGYYRESPGGSGFVPVTPSRMFDSRNSGKASLNAGVEIPLKVVGVSGGAPAGAIGVALNVTVIEPDGYGYLQVYPCDAASSSNISNINYVPMDYRPNSVVTPVDDQGRICLRSHRDTDVAIDFTGYFAEDGGFDFVPLDPIRLFDSRSAHRELNESTSGRRLAANQVVRLKIAGERGVPASAKAVSVNLTATDVVNATYLTVYPCGVRPNTSNVNIVTSQFVTANGAMVKLSADGELCVYSKQDVHVILDINGVWE